MSGGFYIDIKEPNLGLICDVKNKIKRSDIKKM